jgi:hypothetical protein
MNPDLLSHFARPIIGVAVAGAAYIGETVTPNIPGVPEWVTALGLPVAFLIAVIYALVTTHKAYRDSERGRREDLMGMTGKLEAMIEKGNESRERLIRATDLQTQEFKFLADQLKNRPCQVHKP